MRTGIIAKKIGMTRLYLADGTHVPVTVLSVKNCQVIDNKTSEKNGYTSITLGSEDAKAKNVSKAQREFFAKIKVAPKKKVKEFRVDDTNTIEVGKEVGANHFIVGQYIDASFTTIGKGFAGAMKRHNFGGLRASHGVSISHRSHGSTGNSQDPGRVFKGKKMAGHMGSRQRTIQNLQVVAADSERGLIFIKGGVPGSKGSWLSLKDSVKKAVPTDAPFPAGFLGDAKKVIENTNLDNSVESNQEKEVEEKQEIDQIKAENTNESVKVEDKKIVKELSKESGEVATKETKQEITKAEDENVNDSSKVEDKEVTNESPKEEEK